MAHSRIAVASKTDTQTVIFSHDHSGGSSLSSSLLSRYNKITKRSPADLPCYLHFTQCHINCMQDVIEVKFISLFYYRFVHKVLHKKTIKNVLRKTKHLLANIERPQNVLRVKR